MKFLTTIVATLLLATASLQAEQIFVLFDGTCGDRVLYEQAIAQQPRMEYYAYHFPLAGGDRLILETGAEGATVQSYLPQGYIYCNDPRLNLQLAERVNAGTDRVFVLLPTANNQYLIQPVVMGAVFQRRGNNFSYSSPLTGFQFDTENGIIGENLAYNNPGAKVYFEGRDNSPCTGYFLFRQLKPNTSYPVIDFKIAPEIGVFERRLGSDGVSTTGGVIVARQVNGIPVVNFLSTVCAGATAAANGMTMPPVQNSPAPTGYSNQPVYTPPAMQAPVMPQPESAAYGRVGSAPVTSSVVHSVNKGETLYAISRKYGTTVDAIRAGNGLTSNDLYPGQQLTISTTTTTPAAVANNQSTVPTLPYNAGTVANSNPGAQQPTPYGTVAQPQAYGQQTSRGGQAVYGEDLHTVQPGETVASIALKYGFTSAKFREINDLGANTVPRVGERLKTSDCNCPAPQEAPPVQAYPQTAPAPQAYGQVAAPQAYGQPAPTTATMGAPQQPQSGTPVGTTTPTYRAPQGYGQPATTAPAPATQITNNPNFGQVVPNAATPSNASMGTLENRGQTNVPSTNPSTYGSYPAPQPAMAPAAAPTAYGAPAATPSAYGTPVGANAPVGNPAAPQANRSFHLVQEGESLYSISRRYGISTDEVRRLNNLKPTDVIVPFQKLYVN